MPESQLNLKIQLLQKQRGSEPDAGVILNVGKEEAADFIFLLRGEADEGSRGGAGHPAEGLDSAVAQAQSLMDARGASEAAIGG